MRKLFDTSDLGKNVALWDGTFGRIVAIKSTEKAIVRLVEGEYALSWDYKGFDIAKNEHHFMCVLEGEPTQGGKYRWITSNVCTFLDQK